MKKIILLFVILAIVNTGCASKKPDPYGMNNPKFITLLILTAPVMLPVGYFKHKAKERSDRERKKAYEKQGENGEDIQVDSASADSQHDVAP